MPVVYIKICVMCGWISSGKLNGMYVVQMQRAFAYYDLLYLCLFLSVLRLFYPSGAWVDRRIPLGVKENITG